MPSHLCSETAQRRRPHEMLVFHCDSLKYLLIKVFQHFQPILIKDSGIRVEDYHDAIFAEKGIEFEFRWKIGDRINGKRVVCDMPYLKIVTTDLDPSYVFDDFDPKSARSVSFKKLTHLSESADDSERRSAFKVAIWADPNANVSSSNGGSLPIMPVDELVEDGDEEGFEDAADSAVEMDQAGRDSRNEANILARIAKFTFNAFDGCDTTWFKFSIKWPNISETLMIEKRFTFTYLPRAQKLIIYDKSRDIED